MNVSTLSNNNHTDRCASFSAILSKRISMLARSKHPQMRSGRCGLLILMITMLAGIALPWHSVAARTTEATSETATGVTSSGSTNFALPQNPYTDDLIVDHDDTLKDDIVVFSGDVTIEEGGEIIGSLTVFSGDIKIEVGGRVEGDVTSMSGDVALSGKILGDLAVLSGDIKLEENSLVEGNVSVLSGEVDRDENAQIGGNLEAGPGIDFSSFFSSLVEEPAQGTAGAANKPTDDVKKPEPPQNRRGGQHEQTTFFQDFLGFIGRLLGAGVGISVVAVGAGFLARTKPHYVESVRQRLRKEMAANFAVGFLFNMVLGLLAIIFAITFCLMPMSLISGGLLLAVNGIGWTAIAATVGRRLTGYTDVALQSVATVVLGALVLTAPFAALWATGGGCLRFMGLLAAFVIASAGAGSVLAPWLKRLSSDELTPAST